MSMSKSLNKTISAKSKQLNTDKLLEQRIRKQLAPLFKDKPIRSIKKKYFHMQVKSSQYTSPTSCQSSEFLSKNHSKENIKNFTKDKSSLEKGVKKKKIKTSHKSFSRKNLYQKEKQKNASLIEEEESKKNIWRNNVLQRFALTSSYCTKCRNQHISSLQQTLRMHFDQDPSHNLLTHALNEASKKEQEKLCELNGSARVIVIDWMLLISASLLLNRETVHLAIHYMDSYFQACGQVQSNKVHTIAGACLYLSVKQEERQLQKYLIQTLCLSEKHKVEKGEIIEMQHTILIKLNFKLKSNTLAFWIDYFTSKWDSFTGSKRAHQLASEIKLHNLLQIRDTEGQSYQFYREIMEISDCCLLVGGHNKFTQVHIALGVLYLVLRIQLEKTEQIEQQKINLFQKYHKQFLKKPSPIFKDPLRINQLYNCFLTQLCDFQLTQIIPAIKYLSIFLNIPFCFNVDEKAFDEAQSYEDFIRKITYSPILKDYLLSNFNFS